eukprot:gnl/MRDRNA2_/MRDRNA2_60977_c0_seq2.p1 gnl/MRDRNA2_/MRDRNA2_60977_c0~~gnl/MRDRNA2_/MRDRNA2_60977_c0_seq2.p1  ORF type:complete len:882 (+),score=194.31 gnl/MRDRNA2_/MRDRNA2_60977_c0_seq2:2-2647(+)
MKVGMLRLSEMERLLQFGGLREADFFDLVMSSGAGFVQYNTFLEWLCSGYQHDRSETDQHAKHEIEKLKQENQKLKTQNEDLLAKKAPGDGTALNRKSSKSSSKCAEEAYSEAFLSVGGQKALDACYDDFIEIGAIIKHHMMYGGDVPGKSPWEQDIIYQGLSTGVLLHDARLALPSFENACEALKQAAIQEGLDASVLMAPIKGLVRSDTKVKVKYSGDLTQLSDICRATLSVTAKKTPDGQDDGTLERIYAFLKKSVKCPPQGVSFTHFHDRFQKPLWGGYRDFLLLMCVRGLLCEIQVNIDAMLRVKEGVGHDTYEVERLHNDLMLEAAQMNDASAVWQHLKKGARPNYTTGVGISPLSYAALHDNPSMAQELLKKGANPFRIDGTGQIPLSRAVLAGKFKVAKVIVDAMAEVASDRSKTVNAKGAQLPSISSWAILYLMSNASFNLNKEATPPKVASELLTKFEPVFTRLTGGLDAALKDAVRANLSWECDVLIKAKAQVNRILVEGTDHYSIVDWAVVHGASASVQVLIRHDAAPLDLFQRDGKKYTEMKERIIKDDLAKQLEALLQASRDWLDVDEFLCRTCSANNATEKGKVDIARVLLQEGATGAQLDASQLAVLVEAFVLAQDEDMLNLLLMRRRNACSNDKSNFNKCGHAVRGAAKLGLERIVRMLADVGCPLEERDECGSTAMHFAARGGYVGVMRLLHEYGCAVDGPGEADRTPACEATKSGELEVLKALSDDMGCDVTKGEGLDTKAGKRDPDSSWDRTLVHIAAMAGESEIIQWLSSKGCDVNFQAKCLGNKTPLHCAAESNAKEAFQRLIDLGADPEVFNDDQMTPLDVLKQANENYKRATHMLQSDTGGYNTSPSQFSKIDARPK